MDKKTDTVTHDPVPEMVAFWEQRGDTLHRIAEVPAKYRDSIYSLIQEAGQTIHPNAEPVRVVEVDTEEAKRWLAPRNKAQPCHPEQLFPSALAASHHLGYSYNEVAQRLNKARKEAELAALDSFGAERAKTIRLRPSVTIRGVTLQWEKDVPG